MLRSGSIGGSPSGHGRPVTTEGAPSAHTRAENLASNHSSLLGGVIGVDNIAITLDEGEREGNASSLSLSGQLQAIRIDGGRSLLREGAENTSKPRPYLEQLAQWRDEALKMAQSREESKGIKIAVDILKNWVKKGNPSQHLVLKDLKLKNLPPLPAEVLTMDVGNNLLTHLPVLPPSLVEVGAACNHLRTISEPLPPHLRAFDLHDNQLSYLPNELPSTLDVLDVHNNRLVCLPEALPPRLTILLLEDNPITFLPEAIMTLPQDCEVHLANIPLPRSVLDRLHVIVSASNYRGPCFYISQESALTRSAPQALSLAAALWYPSEKSRSVQRAWARFDKTEGAADFSAFLDKLRDSIHFSRPDFKADISHWLGQLVLDKELRALVFAVAKEALGSCEDRAALTLNAMRHAQLNLDVERGNYDANLAELVSVGRQMFRLHELEMIAREKAGSLRLVDEIEVYLAYQVKLSKILNLPVATAQMRFFDVSYVTEADLNKAVQVIKQREEQSFLNYLASDWGPWQSVLKRFIPNEYSAAQDRLSTVVEEEFAARQKAWLVAEGLADNESNRIKVSPLVLKSISQEILGGLTQRFLSQRKIELST